MKKTPKKYKTIKILESSDDLLEKIAEITNKSKSGLISELVNELATLVVSFEKCTLVFDNSHDRLTIKCYGKKLPQGVTDDEP